MAETVTVDDLKVLDEARALMERKGEHGTAERLESFMYDHRCYECERPLTELELEDSAWPSDPTCNACLKDEEE